MTEDVQNDSHPMMRPSKFLVCINDSDESRVALRFACIKAKKRGGVVDILHVLEPADIQTLFAVADKMREERRQEAEALMKRFSDEAFAISGITPNLILREGQIGAEIVAASLEDVDANMLVLGASPASSNKGRILSGLVGQLGDKLLIPMMLVPGNLTDQQIEELS